MRIDAHVHISPNSVPPPPRGIAPRPPGMPAMAPPPKVTPEAVIDMMHRHAIDAAVLSPATFGLGGGDQERTTAVARMVNEELAEIIRAHPTQFAGLAVLPLPDVDAAIAEVRHALDELVLDGVLLTTNVGGTYHGDTAWEPVYAELDRRGAYVFLHPTMPPNGLPLPHPPWLYEFTFDTTRALVNLIYSGTLERYPRIRWQVAHCGGTAPFLAERIASLAVREPALAELAPAGAQSYLSRLYYDTGLANNEIAYRTTRMVAPADHILFGTDWPSQPLPQGGGDPAPGLAFLEASERADFDANVTALVPRLDRSPADSPAIA